MLTNYATAHFLICTLIVLHEAWNHAKSKQTCLVIDANISHRSMPARVHAVKKQNNYQIVESLDFPKHVSNIQLFRQIVWYHRSKYSDFTFWPYSVKANGQHEMSVLRCLLHKWEFKQLMERWNKCWMGNVISNLYIHAPWHLNTSQSSDHVIYFKRLFNVKVNYDRSQFCKPTNNKARAVIYYLSKDECSNLNILSEWYTSFSNKSCGKIGAPYPRVSHLRRSHADRVNG